MLYPSPQEWLQEVQRDRAVPEPRGAEEGWEMQVMGAGLTRPPPPALNTKLLTTAPKGGTDQPGLAWQM